MPVTAKENMDPPHRKDSTGGGGGLEFVTTRFPTAATAPRVSVNPLQFVKVAPPKLFVPPAGGLPSAAEREKEEKERRRKLSQAAEEDWQANLDNWKSSRLKRVEHIVERVEEVRRVEQEDSVWSITGRRKSKTFNEMMEERSSRGVRKTSLGLLGLSYPADDDDGGDVFSSGTSGGDSGCATSKEPQDWGTGSDRGTSATSSLSGLDSGGQLSEAETEKEAPAVKENGTKAEDNNNNNDRGNNGNEGDNGNHGEGPEEEIYTYERAIQEYVNYTERRNSGGVAVMERKNGEVTATLPDVRNGVSDGPSSPKKQSNGPSTFESVKNSVQSWTVDEEAEDGSGETEEETEEEVLRRISFKEKLASFRNLENSKVKNLPATIVDVHVPDAKEKNSLPIKSKTEVQDDKVVVYHANEDSGIHTGDTSQSEGEGEISTPLSRNTKQELSKTMESSAETVVKDQKCDGVAKSDSEKEQGGGSSVLSPDLPRKEVANECREPSKPSEETPIQPKSKFSSAPTIPTKSPAKPPKPDLNKSPGQADSKPITPPVTPPVKSPRTPPVPPPRPSHKPMVPPPVVSPTNACPVQKTPEVIPQESVPPASVFPATQESPKRTLEPSKETNETKECVTEPLCDSVNSSPVKSSSTDVSASKGVASMPTLLTSPAVSEETCPQAALVEASIGAKVPQEEKVDITTLEVVGKKDDLPIIDTSSNSSLNSHGDAVVVAKHVKESSLDHSSGYSSAETITSQHSVPKVVPSLLSESTMVPPSLGELRGLEALDALLSATPPPSTPLPPMLDLTSEDVHVVGGLGFALGTPAKTLAPPKEKPPPPPTSSPPSTPTGSLTRKSTSSSAGSGIGDFRRRNSTKRIRKEIRRKRSDFLGIDAGHEGSDGDGEDVADELEPPELLTIPRDVPTSSECTAEEEDEEDGEYGEEDVEQELVRLQEQEPSPTPRCGLDVSSSPLPGETEEEEEEERSSCQTQETDSGVELTEKDREDRRGKKIVEVEEIEDRRIARIQGLQGLYDKEVEAKKNVNNQYYGSVVAEPASAMHHQSMQDVRMREIVNEEPILCSREEPIHTCPPATLRRSLPDFACADGGENGHPQQINHSEQPPWRRPQPPPVPPHKPRAMPPAEVTSPPKTNMRQAHLRALNVPPKPRIIPTDGWVSPEVRSSHPYDWNGSPQHPLSPTNVPHQTNHPFANSLPRNHMLMQGGAPIRSPERRSSQPSGYPVGSPVKNDAVHPGGVDGMQRDERESVPRRKKTDGSGGYNYQHWLIQEAEHRRITEMQDRRRSHNGVPTSRETVAEETVTNGSPSRGKPLPDSIIQTLTQRVQGRTAAMSSPNHRPQEPQRTRSEGRPKSADLSVIHHQLQNSPRHPQQQQQRSTLPGQPPSEKMLSVSGKKKCSHCSQELGRGAAMIIESLRLFYHIGCFRCCVCHAQLGDGLVGADVRVRAGRLHCHHCYSSDDGVKFSCV
ncbi:mediator of DNA damage checkpoint protein 1 [Ischnura elegans]|uniref:mediator of DNA damage checkpoint protein 1 n=1 Tax=Ischnura elegans TaxID=197161 RepID=UPI001ED88AE3|nr:mediator of DNA damage checkpoint protein 1 [Ischnura elegans]XP_046403610.1 mediator of DNA damage checkpoint protein 1 [Ischnura elegans]XP_046403617.1 mediator of DNA damage checkpoint protein 1 [Ischnura elegans]XP_046403625.1 mediator of DNA damage checkpoint protein 1 [Ischnura elegans]